MKPVGRGCESRSYHATRPSRARRPASAERPPRCASPESRRRSAPQVLTPSVRTPAEAQALSRTSREPSKTATAIPPSLTPAPGLPPSSVRSEMRMLLALGDEQRPVAPTARRADGRSVGPSRRGGRRFEASARPRCSARGKRPSRRLAPARPAHGRRTRPAEARRIVEPDGSTVISLGPAELRRPRLSTASTRSSCRPSGSRAGSTSSRYGAVVSVPRGGGRGRM